ncbi:MAG: YtxH domain-containing protein [Firmicutes bacterium]|nr:YtxH domain-containing protein [Bacillota bacterium]
MRRGLLAGLVIGGVLGAYYGMSMGNREQRRLRRMANDLMSRGEDMMDMMKDKASHMMQGFN